MPDAPHTNRLADETSPYLLQHAHNPVDWYPWSDEAFAEAQRRGVPVFLSIGYSTCYWCHVMERESFENESIAKAMNELFVCIKVDREERPDIDEIYMAATTIFTGSGGWPMSVFLDPATRKPFYAGTYFPAEPMHGRPALTELLRGLSDAWKRRHDEVIEQSNRLADAVAEQINARAEPVPLGQGQITDAVTALLQRFDKVNGGFGHAPKFPQPVFLDFLLDVRSFVDGSTAAAIDLAVRKTLDAMAIGGIHDQIAGGFHRYSVDEFWTVPHFEKMLYDNAQLASTYTRAGVIYDDPYYAGVARRTLDYCLREMTAQNQPGATGFYSAQDAEVDGKEGLNYLWTRDEFESALADQPDLLKLAIDLYGLDASPNFQDPHHPDEPKRFVLRLSDRPDALAAAHSMTTADLLAKLDRINQALLTVRNARKQPRLDDKVLVSWNGLLIDALVEAGTAFDEARYLEAAQHASEFITTQMQDSRGGLLRTYRANSARVPAILEDYAMLIKGLVALQRAPLARNKPSIESITALAETAHTLFADDTGAYHDTRENQPDLFVRTRSLHDGAVPSANGVMLHDLIDLAELTDSPRFAARAVDLLRSGSPTIAQSPISAINSARALLRMLAEHERYGSLYAFATGDTTPQAPPAKPRSPVTVLASTDSIVVGDDRPASFMLALEIDPGYHIVAAEPGDSEAAKALYPLRVGLISGQGIAIYADYPDGTESGVESVGTFNINSGRIEFDVAIEKADGVGASPGKPVLGVSFQACDENSCLAPQTVQLAIDITIE